MKKYITIIILFFTLTSWSIYNPQVFNVVWTSLDPTLEYDVIVSPEHTNDWRRSMGQNVRVDSGTAELWISCMVSDDRRWYISLVPVDTNDVVIGPMAPIKVVNSNGFFTPLPSAPAAVSGLNIQSTP
jgi:hypothetical protein